MKRWIIPGQIGAVSPANKHLEAAEASEEQLS